ncbi:Hsp70 family protein [Streptomyces sp. ISL-43]|nr:Hsp70 family protein [Streptomyces sp. ISL-43]MBT2450859.1 Hsp70 family protein [Streptomyces sp. ISL-43]
MASRRRVIRRPELKRDAEAYLGEDVTDAVVTVPAYLYAQVRRIRAAEPDRGRAGRRTRTMVRTSSTPRTSTRTAATGSRDEPLARCDGPGRRGEPRSAGGAPARIGNVCEVRTWLRSAS